MEQQFVANSSPVRRGTTIMTGNQQLDNGGQRLITLGDNIDEPRPPGATPRPNAAEAGDAKRARIRQAGEVILVFAIFSLLAWEPTPNVNESHYLTKAKHFWDHEWCAGDLFLESGFPHAAFYWTFGWLTHFFSLSTAAWIGRMAGWMLLAYGWCQLSRNFVSHWLPLAGSAFALVLLNHHFHLAGEWVVGGIEAKVPAYGFLFLAFGALVKGKWRNVGPLLGLATAFHVLVGGWGWLAAAFAWMLDRNKPTLKPATWIGVLIGIAISAFGLLPALSLAQHAAASTVDAANEIYVRLRISHHLDFWSFAKERIFLFMLAVAAYVAIFVGQRRTVGSKRIGNLTLASLLIALLGVAIASLPDSENFDRWSNSLLRFYWFRLADVMVPAFLSLAFFSWLQSGSATKPVLRHILGCAVAIVLLVASGGRLSERLNDPRPGADRQALPTYDDRERTIETQRNWVRACRWIRDNTERDARFLTPSSQQTFKWFAERVDIACWKDIPQDAASMVAWYERIRRIHPPGDVDFGLISRDDDGLRKLATELQADYLVIEQRLVDTARLNGRPFGLKQVYPVDPSQKTTYMVFRF